MKNRRVDVTGDGAQTPIGNNINDYWKNLINGKSGAAPITRFNAEKFKTRFACEVKDFDPSIVLNRKESRKLDLFSQYALVVADEAVKNSEINIQELNPDRSGVIWGSGIGGMCTFFNESLNLLEMFYFYS